MKYDSVLKKLENDEITAEEALDLIMLAVNACGYEKKIGIAMDPAASEFYNAVKKKYILHREFSAKQLKNYYHGKRKSR